MTKLSKKIEDAPDASNNYWRDWVLSKVRPLPLENSSVINVADLFCGCGGMSLGVSEAARSAGLGFSVAFAADNSEFAEKIYRANFSSQLKSFYSGDISSLFPPEGLGGHGNNKCEEYGKIDILVAGPPCQGHSNLNNSTRRDDPRNRLYLSAITAIETLKPTIAIVENVPAVIHDKTEVTQNSNSRLTAAGYEVEEIVLHVDKLGLPQRRKRHLLIARLKTIPGVGRFIEDRQTRPATLLDFIGDIADEWKTSTTIFSTPSKMSALNQERVKVLFGQDIYDLPDSDRPSCHRDKEHSYKSAYGRLKWDEAAQTITSGFGSMGQGRYIHPSEKRTITPHEAARIQGFPDFFDFSQISQRTKLQESIANAVPPPAIATIVKGFIEVQAFDRSKDGKKEGH